MVAAHPDPVIAVPMKTSDLGGLDSLLSMVQMPSGVPVATVAINGAKNAAILAVQIMGTGCSGARQKIIDMKKAMAGRKSRPLAKGRQGNLSPFCYHEQVSRRFSLRCFT